MLELHPQLLVLLHERAVVSAVLFLESQLGNLAEVAVDLLQQRGQRDLLWRLATRLLTLGELYLAPDLLLEERRTYYLGDQVFDIQH
jgi:hypothetical protein